MPNSAKRARDRHAKKNTTLGRQIAHGAKKTVNKKKRETSRKRA